MWWSWDHDTASLFRALDPVLWRELDHNPIALLQQIPVARLEERASALVLHSRINYAYRRMQEHLTSTRTWGARNAGVLWARPVAYFSAEFGLHESVPIYSGGLGILAGDHIKAASDLGIPLVGIGLYYDQGYFTQRFDLNGYQQEDYRDVDSSLLPLEPARDASGQPVTVSIDTRTGTICRARVEAGRRQKYAAAARFRRRGQPAGGSRAHVAAVRRRRPRPHPPGAAARRGRRQGADGARHLAGRACTSTKDTARLPRWSWRAQRMVTEGIGAAEALRRISSQVVFTTHTPVPAGHDRFSRRPRRRAPRPAARRDGHEPRTICWRWAASIRPIRTKASA